MIKEHQQLLRIFLKWTEAELGNYIKAIILFGSLARDQAISTSDIDLLVIYNGDRKEITSHLVNLLVEIRGTQEYKSVLEKGYGAEIYPFLVSEAMWKDTLWILLDISDHGVILKDSQDIAARKLKMIRERIKYLGGRRVPLPNNKWYWILTDKFETLGKGIKP